jgi:hypothetical protein
LAGKSKSAIAKAAGKKIFRQDRGITEGDRSWTRTWIPKMIGFEELGVLEDWLSAIESVQEHIRSLGPKVKSTYETKEIKNLLKHTSGYFAYPAGVFIKGDKKNPPVFVEFPNPLDIGIDRLMAVSNPLDLDDFEVIREDKIPTELHVLQTQPRAGERK